MSRLDIIFVSSHFYLSEVGAIAWINKHTQEDLDNLFDKVMECA